MADTIPRDVVPDRIGFFRNGWLVDEVVFSNASVSLRQTTPARYTVHLAAPTAVLALDLWTTPRGRIHSNLFDGPAPSWLRGTSGGDALEVLGGDALSVHFEHMDRNFYYLGLSGVDEHWSVTFAGAGYLKLAPARPSAVQRQHMQVASAISCADLRPHLAHALRVEPARIVFAPSEKQTVGSSLCGQIVVMASAGAGDFPTGLTVDSTEQRVVIAARLACSLQCRVRVPSCDEAEGTHTTITSRGDILPMS